MENYISGLESVKETQSLFSSNCSRIVLKIVASVIKDLDKKAMMSQSSKIFLLLNIFSVIRASRLETVHFTNSANKILKANNFTTYKVDVPNGEPITIIEANVPLIDKKIKFDDVEPSQYPKRHNQFHDNDSSNRKYHNKPVMDLETSLSMTVTPNNYHDEYENSAASANGEEESVKNDYSNLSPEQLHNNDRNTMKTVYSPELLQKFLKDYANKVHMATSSTASTENFNVEKDKYVESQEQTSVDDDDGNRRVSNVENEDKSEELEDVQQRKNYRPGNHPYNKNSGWVTLDAVPWSKSKVSRWQSSQKPQNNYNNRPYRPPSSSAYDYDYNGSSNDNNDDYYAPKPSRPTYHNNQFYNNRPQSQESHSWHTSQQFHSSSHNDRPNHNSNRPSEINIITDNRPSNFPSHNEDHYHNQQSHQQPQHNYAFSKPYNRPSSYGSSNDYSYNNHGNHYNSFKDGPHPQTYPQNGELKIDS